MLYEDSQIILAEVEARMLGVSDLEMPLVRSAWCETGGPFKYIRRGLREFFRHGQKFYCWQFITLALCAITAILLPAEIRHIFSLPLTLAMLLAPMFFTVFSVPSTYAHGGVTSADVEHACSVISDRKMGGNSLEVLKANIEILEQPVKQRAARLQLMLAGLWGFWVYWFWSLPEPRNPVALTVGGIMELAIYSLLLLALFLSVQGYSKAHGVLFSTIYLAINELKEPPSALLSSAPERSHDDSSRASHPSMRDDGQHSVGIM